MQINNKNLQLLRNNYGDAFYLLDSERFKNNFIELKQEFQSIYSNFNIAYSYKTNYTPKLCKIVNELGGYAEVVSEMELELAYKIGTKSNRIIWNGPIKNPVIMEKFLLDGGTVNIDSFEEFNQILILAEKNKKNVFNVGVRCNFDIDDGVISRFGIDINNLEFKNAIRKILNTSNIKLINLQCHFAKRNLEYWPQRAKKILKIIDEIGYVPERIDLGGGLYGKMDPALKKQFNMPIPNYTDYAIVVAEVFKERFPDYKPELVIEPGTALVGDCMKFACTVKTIKNVQGKNIVSVLGSQKNINMVGINPPIEIFSMGERQQEYENADFVGFTCIESDVIYTDFNGKIAINDMLVISNCGSYSIVMKPPFILPNFPIIDISHDNPEIVKRGEMFDDIFSTFIF